MDRLERAECREQEARALWQSQCTSLTEALLLFMKAVGQQRIGGWVAAWQENGGKHPTDYTARIQALQKAETLLPCTDQLFEDAGEELWGYLAHCHSLCVTPAYLWEHLAEHAE